MSAGRRTRLALALLATLLVFLAILYWRTPRAVAFTPQRNSQDTSKATPIRLRFSSALQPPYPQLQLSPPVSGTQRQEGNSLIFTPARPLAPETTYTVTLSGSTGACLRCDGLQWQFRTSAPALLYVAWDDAGHAQLYRTDDEGATALALTAAAEGINDYAVSPYGDTIVFSARRDDGGASLWRVDRRGQDRRELVACPGALCDGASWAPDGQRLIYVRRTLEADGAGTPTLYWLDAASGATEPVFARGNQAGWFPRFAPTGEWLAFVEPGPPPAVLAYPLTAGQPQLLPGETTAPVSWHPHENRFISSVILYEGERAMTHLFMVAVATQAIADISGDVDSDDSGAAWSPAGDWIAFARKVARAPVGKQIWLMRPDGSEAQPLTGDPDSNFSNLGWSPDGQLLLAQRFGLDGSGDGPEVVLLPLDGGRPVRVTAPAYAPAWLP